MKTVIMAGGRGTRIRAVAPDLPKPMIPICGKPVLEHEIQCLKEQGFTDIILTVSHLGQRIMNYFGDGSSFGVQIEYYFEEVPLGNAGALFQIKERLSEDFLLLNGDALFHVDFNRFVQYHREKGGLATLFTHPNSHPFDSGLIIAGKDGIVEDWLTKEDKRPEFYKNRVNAGLHVISRALLDIPAGTGQVDLDRQLLKPLKGTGKLYVYDSPEYVKDMGTPERYARVCRDYESGKVKARNLKNQQRAVFLDRDGTLNKYQGFLTDISQLELLPSVSLAIKAINDSGYLAIVITNQPVIARGQVSERELEEIHNKLETLLGKDGAYVDAIYYCPHHPHKGFQGEKPEYKIDCECRKPKPGLLYRAAEEFHINLSQSWMVGDSKNDILAGKAARCKTALLSEHKQIRDIPEYGQDLTVISLKEFTDLLFQVRERKE